MVTYRCDACGAKDLASCFQVALVDPNGDITRRDLCGRCGSAVLDVIDPVSAPKPEPVSTLPPPVMRPW